MMIFESEGRVGRCRGNRTHLKTRFRLQVEEGSPGRFSDQRSRLDIGPSPSSDLIVTSSPLGSVRKSEYGTVDADPCIEGFPSSVYRLQRVMGPSGHEISTKCHKHNDDASLANLLTVLKREVT